MPLRMQHQPSQPESLLTPPALEDLPPDVYRKPSRPQQATSTDHLMSPCYAIRLMQAQMTTGTAPWMKSGRPPQTPPQ
jgi:hypothetical protein